MLVSLGSQSCGISLVVWFACGIQFQSWRKFAGYSTIITMKCYTGPMDIVATWSTVSSREETSSVDIVIQVQDLSTDIQSRFIAGELERMPSSSIQRSVLCSSFPAFGETEIRDLCSQLILTNFLWTLPTQRYAEKFDEFPSACKGCRRSVSERFFFYCKRGEG